jgi:uncharacterized circularly permuted ATP-grasp superfamily protein/uncharacterized alpha-E superfamily protein
VTGSTALARLDDSDGARLTEAYRQRALAREARSAPGLHEVADHIDELLGTGGSAHPHTADLAASIDLLGLAGLLDRRAEAARLVEDEGVTYGVAVRDGESAPNSARRWKVDPLPVILDAAAWARLEAGLIQRAHLFDRILADLYGRRDLLHRGVVPAEAVLSHPGFVRQADGLRVPGRHQLFLAATDLGRDGAGNWRVIGDRTQAPSGAGYAIQTRRIVGRVMPGLYRDSGQRRLRGFFDTVRSGLQEVAPSSAEVPRVVLLTPGPGSETAFDQAFLATLLGYPLVTGEDLTVRDGRVHMRSLGRLEPVDVLLRRVDADYTDPLELRAESQLGAPGLLEACRSGSVSVVNSFGSGVLESPGLMAFLPDAARALLGEDLTLPAVPTWWCGLDSHRRHVLANLERLVIKPVDRSQGMFGWELAGGRREELSRAIEAAPHAWSAQEPIPMSTAPVVTGRGLEPRRFTLRTFTVASGESYQVMAGGLGRVAGRAGNHVISNATGALAKDVWVLSPTAPAAPPIEISPAAQPVPADLDLAPRLSLVAGLPPRVAENLFWLGRYAERAEDTVRVLRVVDDLAEDWAARQGTPGAATLEVMLRALRRLTGTGPGFTDPDGARLRQAPHGELLALVVDGGREGTVAYAVRRTVDAAQALREQLSLDTWIVLGSLNRVLDELAEQSRSGTDPRLQPVLARVMEGLLALAGLGAESMVRDVGWHFMDAGRRLERALKTAALLRYTLDREYAEADEAMVLEAVLIAGESIITHRRRNPGRAGTGAVLDLLLLDRENPRSVALQLDRLSTDLAQLPDQPASAAALTGALRQIAARVREFDSAAAARLTSGVRPYLIRELDAIIEDLSVLAVGVEAAHFAHLARPQPTTAIYGWTT